MELLRSGDEIDLMDENDVYCPAIIISTKPLKINYIGWGNNWDETIKNKDEYRIQYPAGKYVKTCKVWVKYHKDICHWPSILYLRLPKEGSKLGIEYLKHEPKVYVKPLGTLTLIETIKNFKSYSKGAWINTNNIWPFNSPLKKRWIENGMIPKYEPVFQEALTIIENSDYLDINFKFNGSYDTSQKKRKRSDNDNNNGNNNNQNSNNQNYSQNDDNDDDNNNNLSGQNSSGNNTPSKLAGQKINEIRKKSFDNLAPNFYLVLENQCPKPKTIDKINQGLIKFYLSTIPTYPTQNKHTQTSSVNNNNYNSNNSGNIESKISNSSTTSNTNNNNNNNHNNININTIPIKKLFYPSNIPEDTFSKSPNFITELISPTTTVNIDSEKYIDNELEKEIEIETYSSKKSLINSQDNNNNNNNNTSTSTNKNNNTSNNNNCETNSNSSDKKRKGNQPQKYEIKRRRN